MFSVWWIRFMRRSSDTPCQYVLKPIQWMIFKKTILQFYRFMDSIFIVDLSQNSMAFRIHPDWPTKTKFLFVFSFNAHHFRQFVSRFVQNENILSLFTNCLKNHLTSKYKKKIFNRIKPPHKSLINCCNTVTLIFICMRLKKNENEVRKKKL